MRKHSKFVLQVLLSLILLGCATIEVPETTDGKILYAKTTLTGLNNGMADLVRSKVVDVETAKKYESRALEAAAMIRIAEKALAEGKEQNALSSWGAVNVILIELNQYLLNSMEARQ